MSQIQSSVLIVIILFTRNQNPFQTGLMEKILYWFKWLKDRRVKLVYLFIIMLLVNSLFLILTLLSFICFICLVLRQSFLSYWQLWITSSLRPKLLCFSKLGWGACALFQVFQWKQWLTLLNLYWVIYTSLTQSFGQGHTACTLSRPKE